MQAEENNPGAMECARLRRQVQTVLRALPVDAFQTESSAIIRHLASWDLVHQAKTIAAFHPSRTEPQIQTLLQAIATSKTLLLPRVLPGNQMEFVHVNDIHLDLNSATFGLMEPRLVINSWIGEAPQIILVPGVVFGKFGERIGHGGGYYDRFLSKFPNSITVGVSLNCQFQNHPIPQLPHDIRMSYIVSPIGIVSTSA